MTEGVDKVLVFLEQNSNYEEDQPNDEIRNFFSRTGTD